MSTKSIAYRGEMSVLADVSCPKTTANSRLVRTFWIVHSALFTTNTFLFESPSSDDTSRGCHLKFFDADGSLINEVWYADSAGQGSIFPVAPFLSSAKLESGLAHGALQVEMNQSALLRCLLVAPGMRFPMDQLIYADYCTPVVMPFSFRAAQRSIIAIVNSVNSPIDFIVRVVYRNQKIETVRTCPAQGTRLLSFPGEYFFLKFVEGKGGTVEIFPCMQGVCIGIQILTEITNGECTETNVSHYVGLTAWDNW
jgi:hypothetical protein